jgi:SAM-dependent methyltransferase
MPDTPSADGGSEQRGVCRICGGTALGEFDCREMMLGLREHFLYRECRACGCLQISEYPTDMDRYYPDTYYSYNDPGLAEPETGRSALKRMRRRAKTFMINRSASTRRGFVEARSTRSWLQSRPVVQLYLQHVPDPLAPILDVGCGGGGLLRSLHYLYYESLHGVDPFVGRDVYLDGRLLVRKAQLRDLTPSYDCISFHHVLEHLPDQLAVLNDVRRLLSPNGITMIRIPVAGGAAWRTYRENWVQLDPPRHFYLHTERSFRLLADRAGFEVDSLEYDSTGLQFWGSELYLRDIPLMDPRSPADGKGTEFSAAELAEFDARAAILNQSREGDQIVAILRSRR